MSYVLLNFMSPDVAADRLTGLTGNVLENMANNPLFPSATPFWTDLSVKQKTFITNQAAAGSGSRADKLLARRAKAELQTSLKAMGRHINGATTDRVALLTTGFDLSKDSRTRVVMEPITGFKVQAGMGEGTLKAGFKRPDGMQAGGFEWVYGEVTTGEASWYVVTTGNRCSVTLTGLTPGNIVTIRGFAEGPREQKVYSQSIVTVVGFNKTAKTA